MVALHESWFTDARPGFDWAFAIDPASLALIGIAIVIAVAWRWIGARVRKPELRAFEAIGRLAPFIPRLLGVHAGVSLLAQAAGGTYLAPGLALPSGPVGSALAILEGIAGVWLIAGYRIRPAAWLLVAAGPIGMVGYGVVPILERLDLLGVAAFLVLLPPSDATAGAVHPAPNMLAAALLIMRVLVGGSLVVLAFTEKLARPELAEAFLDRFPAFNILQWMGVGITDAAFIRLAGSVELLFGLLIISGAMPQLVVIAAGIPFNATLFFLGSSELIGHLPIYGAMLALLVYGSNRIYAGEVPRLAMSGRIPLIGRPDRGWATGRPSPS